MNHLAIPVGVYRVDRRGLVLAHVSVADGILAGSRSAGRNFYEDVAPCTNCAQFRGRVERLLAGGGGAARFDYQMRVPWCSARVEVRIFARGSQSAWILIACPELAREVREVRSVETARPA